MKTRTNPARAVSLSRNPGVVATLAGSVLGITAAHALAAPEGAHVVSGNANISQ